MTTFTSQFLSGGANGIQIAVAATSSPGTTIHTAHATSYDELMLFACNTTTVSVLLTIQFGGTTAADAILVNLAPQAGDVLVVAGKRLTNSLVVKAYASVASVVNIGGYVNRIT